MKSDTVIYCRSVVWPSSEAYFAMFLTQYTTIKVILRYKEQITVCFYNFLQ